MPFDATRLFKYNDRQDFWEAGLSVSKPVSKLETRTSMLDEFQASMASIDTSIDNLKRASNYI
jgi:hypothetical protein